MLPFSKAKFPFSPSPILSFSSSLSLSLPLTHLSTSLLLYPLTLFNLSSHLFISSLLMTHLLPFSLALSLCVLLFQSDFETGAKTALLNGGVSSAKKVGGAEASRLKQWLTSGPIGLRVLSFLAGVATIGFSVFFILVSSKVQSQSTAHCPSLCAPHFHIAYYMASNTTGFCPWPMWSLELYSNDTNKYAIGKQ